MMFRRSVIAIGILVIAMRTAFAVPTTVYEDPTIKIGYLQSGDTVSRAGYSQCTASIGDQLYVRSGNTTGIHPFFGVNVGPSNITISKNQYVTNERAAFICHNNTPTTNRVTTGYVPSGTNIGAGLNCVLTIANFSKPREGCSGCGGSVACSYNATTGVVTASQTERGRITDCGYVCVDPQVGTASSEKRLIISRQYTERDGSDLLRAGASVAAGTNFFSSECSNLNSTGASYNPTDGTVVRGVTGACGIRSFSYIASVATQCSDGADNDNDGLTDTNDQGCSSPDDDNEGDGTSQCQDGIDNDGDGAADFPSDFSCSSRQDNDETNPRSQCQDGIDNDNDGLTDSSDPACTNNQINNEAAATSQCQDGIDNDSDGAADFPNDFSCSSRQDNDETNARSQCQDGIDNDTDGLTDSSDPACTNNQINNEGSATSQCQDGIDNDSDGAADFPNDFSCSSRQDNDETNPRSQCQDGLDNDNDGLTDSSDPACINNQINDESAATSQCQDTQDNDADGLIDAADPGCSSPQDGNEGDESANLAVGVECVMENSNGSKTAYFSYNNATSQPLSLPVAATGTIVNAFSPGAPDQGQPTVFTPGVVRGAVAIPLSGSGVTWTVRASGSAQSSATASAASPRCAAIEPLIECQGYDKGQLRAKGGYQNSNQFDVKLDIGPLNSFSPGSPDRGQPTLFQRGLFKASFGVDLTEPITPLIWDLNGQQVSVSNSLPVCDGECIDTPIGEIRGELDDLAIQISQLTIDAANILAAAADSEVSGKTRKRSSRRRRVIRSAGGGAADAERAKAKAQSFLTQSRTLTIQFPDVIKNCPEAPLFCETVDRGATIDQLRELFAFARNQAQRTIARAYFRQTGSTNRKDQLVRRAKQLETRGIAELNRLPRTETVCK